MVRIFRVIALVYAVVVTFRALRQMKFVFDNQ